MSWALKLEPAEEQRAPENSSENEHPGRAELVSPQVGSKSGNEEVGGE